MASFSVLKIGSIQQIEVHRRTVCSMLCLERCLIISDDPQNDLI